MSRIGRILYGTARLLAQFVFICLFMVRVSGRRNIPRKGGAILASNHQSFLDPVLIGLGLWQRVHFMARAELFDIPIFDRLISALNAFPVRRTVADRKAIREAVSKASAGDLVVVFPEGTRIDHGGLGEMQPGAAFIAKRARCPIVPVAIYGAHRAWPTRYKIFHLAPIRVAFAPPIDPAGRDDKEILEEIRKSIENMLSTMV